MIGAARAVGVGRLPAASLVMGGLLLWTAATASAVGPAAPSLITGASGPVVVGGQLFDTAAVIGGANPTGTVTFRLFYGEGAGDTACVNRPAFVSTSAVSGATATSSSYPATFAGTFRWTATYSGDANNAAVATACNDAHETVQVRRASPTLTTRASPGAVAPGGQISDTASLSGSFDGGFVPCAILAPAVPGATCADSAPGPPQVVFALYGPNDAGCTRAPAFTSRVSMTGPLPPNLGAVSANGTYVSAPFRPTRPGTYRWAAASLEDAANDPAISACNSPNESVAVSAPTLSRLRISPSGFRAAPSGPSIATASSGVVSYHLSEDALVTFTIEKAVPGRSAGGQCLRQKHPVPGAKPCTRFATLRGSFARQGQTGVNTFRFRGRLRGSSLTPGRYRLIARGTDAAGSTTPPKRAGFRILAH
ncbi:MAG: hypothetical protein QOE44_2018 [Solirubrobacteraceae bacterium]|nr:hypothetical protein [Solirubrobacteraceae bacterium]